MPLPGSAGTASGASPCCSCSSACVALYVGPIRSYFSTWQESKSRGAEVAEARARERAPARAPRRAAQPARARARGAAASGWSARASAPTSSRASGARRARPRATLRARCPADPSTAPRTSGRRASAGCATRRAEQRRTLTSSSIARVAELRRRLGGPFTADELVGLYDEQGTQVGDGHRVRGRAEDPWAWDQRRRRRRVRALPARGDRLRRRPRGLDGD